MRKRKEGEERKEETALTTPLLRESEEGEKRKRERKKKREREREREIVLTEKN